MEWFRENKDGFAMALLEMYTIVPENDNIDDDVNDANDDIESKDEIKIDNKYEDLIKKFKLLNGFKYKDASFYQHKRIKYALIFNGIKILKYCGQMYDAGVRLTVIEFLMAQYNININSINKQKINKLITATIKSYIKTSDSNDDISDRLTKRLYSLINSIPKMCKLYDDNRAIMTLKLILGYLNVLTPIYSEISELLYNSGYGSSFIDKILYALTVKCHGSNGFRNTSRLLDSGSVSINHYVFEPLTHQLSFVNILKESEIDLKGFKMNVEEIPLFYEIYLTHLSNDHSQQILYQVCQNFGYFSTDNADNIFYKFRYVSILFYSILVIQYYLQGIFGSFDGKSE